MAESRKDNSSLAVNHKEVSAATQTIIPEIAEAIRQEKGQIDVNILLRIVGDNVSDPESAIKYSQEILEVAEQYENHRLRTWQQRAEAVIDVKNRDPDEIEKRQNNKVRRGLKITVASCAALGVVGAVTCAVMEVGIVVTGVLATIGAISLAMVGPLASGESVSSSDAVRVIEAVKGVFSSGSEEKDGRGNQQKRRKGR